VVRLKENVNRWSDFCLHFDGKTLDFMGFSFEFIAICVTAPSINYTIGLKCLFDDRSAFSIYAAVKECCLENEVYSKIRMIITDTASVNTGKHGGAVTRIINEILPPPV